MTLKQIVQKYLKENNFAGLCNDECGCGKDDLFPCDEPKEDCMAAMFKPCENCDIEAMCDYEGLDGCYYVPVKYGVGE